MADFITAINLVTSNLGIAFEDIILIIVLLGCMAFFAANFQVGAILTFVLSSALFVWFYYLYEAGYPVIYSKAAVVMFASLVVLCLSLYLSFKAESKGVI